jgi:hypothetical protein
VRGDEVRVVDAFCAWLLEQGWTVERELNFCDVVATRGDQRLYAEAKGRTTEPGLDVDTLYGQLLRRIPPDGLAHELGVVVPSSAVKAACRVHPQVRRALNVTIFEVTDSNEVLVLNESR